MYSSSLLQHFKLIEPSQFDEIRRFVRSDYFNRGVFKEEIIVLLEILIAAHPDWTDESLSKEAVHERLFPEKEFLKNRMEKAMSELNVILKEFMLLTYYRREENAFQRNLDWTRLMRKLDDRDRYEMALEKLKKEHERDGKLSVDYFFENYLIQHEIQEWNAANYSGKDDFNLVNTLDSLNNYYIIQGLGHLNNLLITSKAIQIEIPPEVSSKLFAVLSVTDYEANPLLKVHHMTATLLQKNLPSMEDFRAYMVQLKAVEHEMSPVVMRDFYLYARNLCTIITNHSNENLRPVLHEIQVESLNRGYFYQDGKITPNNVLNITRVAIYMNNLEWVETFLQEHQFRIFGETESADFYRANYAVYLFALHKYDEVLEQLPTNNIKNVNYQILVKITEIKCYYELQSVLLHYKMEAFKVYLSRNTNKFFSAEQQFLWSKFIAVLYQVVQCRKGDRVKVNKIKNKIAGYKGKFHEQSWLFEKLDKLL